MLKSDFELLIASSTEQEKVTCEIYFQGEIIAEISQEKDDLLLEIYPTNTKKWWQVPLIEFQNVLENAKNHLLGKS